ncbi:hypothetical protein D3Y59_06815 [Hymenobacter oligotrophus]|uniref:Uncharacterized protein n=1 Tax=Hymenobacter oligotrophus TaxID=2319843 RepID=A0A3B7QZY7_9BACT|nr:hypothetical protein [Hymenobacter oligotrophus]AYA36793.1 hypothetical protein D3Y59_06815 [Hymenobacter oligotrophus]
MTYYSDYLFDEPRNQDNRPREGRSDQRYPRDNRQGAGRSDQDDDYDRGFSRRGGTSDTSSGGAAGRRNGLGPGYQPNEMGEQYDGRRRDIGRPNEQPRRRNNNDADDYPRPRQQYNDNYGRGAALGGSGYGSSEYSGANRGYGQGFAGFNGDLDRGYDESGIRGGLGSGGRDSFSDRNFDVDRNPFRGGYGGGDYDQGGRNQTDTRHMNIGMNSRGPGREPYGRPQPPRADFHDRYDRRDPNREYRRYDNEQ